MNNKDFVGAGASNGSVEIFNPMDIYMEEIYKQLVPTVPKMTALSWLKAIEGRSVKRKVKRRTYSYYEEGQWMKAAAKILTITPNGAKFDVVLRPEDHIDAAGVADATTFVVPRQICMFQDGRTTGYVESVNRVAGANVITIKKYNAAQDIATVATVGSTIVFYGNIQAEASTATESRFPQFEKITNYIHSTRENFTDTDFETQNALWFEANGKQYVYYKGLEDTFERFEFQREAALLLSPQADSLTDANGKPLTSMFGLIPQIEQYGINLEYYNEPDMGGFDEVMLALDNNYAETKYIVGHGHNAGLAAKNFLVKFAQNGTGNISFSPFTGGEQQAINLQFKSYSVMSYEFYFQQWAVFSHKDSLGADGLPFRHKFVFIPAGYAKNPNPDGVANQPQTEPYIQLVNAIRGVAAPIDKGDYYLWQTGAMASPNATNDVMNLAVHMQGDNSLELRCRWKFLQWDKA